MEKSHTGLVVLLVVILGVTTTLAHRAFSIGVGRGVPAVNSGAPLVLQPLPGIENLMEVAPGLLCGGQPADEEAFAALHKEGVRVVISVDAEPPNHEWAARYGMRYVHLPIGYDGIPPQSQADLAAAMRMAGDAVVYVHCHHGRHRGPAAAAYAGIVSGKLSQAAGLQLLSLAGTKPEYVGLWDAIRKYETPILPSRPLTAQAEVEPLAATMVRIDHQWKALGGEAFLKAPGDTKNSVPSLDGVTDPQRVAVVLLAEEFRELARQKVGPDAGYQLIMQQAADQAQVLSQAMISQDRPAVQFAVQRVLETCTQCHASYRQ